MYTKLQSKNKYLLVVQGQGPSLLAAQSQETGWMWQIAVVFRYCCRSYPLAKSET